MSPTHKQEELGKVALSAKQNFLAAVKPSNAKVPILFLTKDNSFAIHLLAFSATGTLVMTYPEWEKAWYLKGVWRELVL